MEKYTAFISYRHKPIDIAVATRLHRLLERYTVPKALRKNGQKKLGKVFRDRDELSLDSDLTQRLRDALDASDYLIVVCTPDTPASPWVAEEIRYFKTHHDESRVFTVVADGKSDETFPAPLTQSFDSDGNVIEGAYRQPLAANIVAESDRERMRKLDDEFLRLVAPMLGCTYDELYRREARYRRKRRFASLSAVAAVAVVIVSIVLVKNAQIRRQFIQTQINESNALAKVSLNELQQGNAYQALKTAFSAVPGETDRPLTLDAQIALAKSLYAYQPMAYRADISIELYSTVQTVRLTKDGTFIALLDDYDNLFVYSGFTGELLWYVNCSSFDVTGHYAELYIIEDLNALVYKDVYSFSVYDLASGDRLRSVFFKDHAFSKLGLCFRSVFSADAHLIACALEDADKAMHIVFYDVVTGEAVSATPALSASEQLTFQSGVFSSDGKTYYAAFNNRSAGNDAYYMIGTADGDVKRVTTLDDNCYNIGLKYLEDNNGNGNALAVFGLSGNSNMRCALIYDKDAEWANYAGVVYAPNYRGGDQAYIFDDGTVIRGYSGSSAVEFGRDYTNLSVLNCSSEILYACPGNKADERCFVMLNGQYLKLKSPYNENRNVKEKYTVFDYPAAGVYGTGTEGGPLCVVPADRTNTICVFRIQGDDNKTVLPWPEQIHEGQGRYGCPYALPDGIRFLYVDYEIELQGEDPSVYDYYFSIYNAADKTVEKTIRLTGSFDPILSDPSGFSEDGRKIFFNNYVLDTDTEVLTRISANGGETFLSDGSNAAYHGTSDRIYAVLQKDRIVWWINGENPVNGTAYADGISTVYLKSTYTNSTVKNKTLVVGGSGLAAFPAEGDKHDALDTFMLYSTEKDAWNRVQLAGEYEKLPLAYAVCEKTEKLAVAEPDNTVRFYDMKHQNAVGDIPLMIPAYSISEMCFLMDDTVLALHQCSIDGKSGHRLWLIDASDGTILQNLSLKGFTDISTVNLQTDADTKLLMVGSDCDAAPGYVIDTESWTVLYEIPHDYCYLYGLKSVVSITELHKELVLLPVYDIGALSAWAQRNFDARTEKGSFGTSQIETETASELQTEAPAQDQITQTAPGNSGNNLRWGNSSAEDDAYYYLSGAKNAGIIRVSKTDGKTERILADGRASYLNAVDDWIYFLDRDKCICRVPKNGLQKEKLSKDKALNLLYADGLLYFCCKEDGDYNIYSCLPDGTDKKPVLKDVLGEDDYVIADDTIYFSGTGDRYSDLCKTPLQGGEITVLLEELNGKTAVFSGPVYVDGWVYYRTGVGVGRIRPDGTENEIVAENNDVYYFVVGKDSVFFNTFSSDEPDCIYACSLSDGKTQVIAQRETADGGYSDLAIYENALVYMEYEGGGGDKRMVVCDLSDATLQTNAVYE